MMVEDLVHDCAADEAADQGVVVMRIISPPIGAAVSVRVTVVVVMVLMSPPLGVFPIVVVVAMRAALHIIIAVPFPVVTAFVSQGGAGRK